MFDIDFFWLTFWVITVSLTALAVGWTYKSLVTLDPNQMGVEVFMGKPLEWVDSGTHFIPYLFGLNLRFWYIAVYPKTKFDLDFRGQLITTKAGKYKDPATGVEEPWESEEFPCRSVVYLTFPRGEKLIKIMEHGVPADHDGLQNFLAETIQTSVRTASGELVVRELYQNRGVLRDKVLAVLTIPAGTLLSTGFEATNIDLGIQEIDFPEELNKAFARVNSARLAAQAAEYERDVAATKTMGEFVARLRQIPGIDIAKIKAMFEEDAEFRKQVMDLNSTLSLHGQAIDGKSFFMSGSAGFGPDLSAALAAWIASLRPGGGTP